MGFQAGAGAGQIGFTDTAFVERIVSAGISRRVRYRAGKIRQSKAAHAS
ncbi:hypothetical protein [Aliiroseovarius crassostreae]|nr:hypothetical protein [Aliiroseovarius crassostreae]UWP89599.1 hypothetical protein K3J57_02545 [Aliiroseovarius crassostreae]UWQ02247.1 hypothetical protein K3X44_02550 [Aliiroseovarius crassostreae]